MQLEGYCQELMNKGLKVLFNVDDAKNFKKCVAFCLKGTLDRKKN